MNVSGNLKKTNPPKYYMKTICNAMYYLGFGSCWYEPREQTALQSRGYLAWATLSNFYTIAGFLNEFLGNFRTDLDAKERNDVVLFNLAHSSILAKIIFNYIYNKDIKMVLERLLEGGRSTFVNGDLDKACVKRLLALCSALGAVTFNTLAMGTADGIKAYFTEGIPVRTEVVYYPSSSSTGLMVNILRFLTLFHWFYAVAIMVAIDCLCIGSLVICCYKFKNTQLYFENLRVKVLKRKRQEYGEEQYRRDLVVGIVMHEDALWCAKNVQSTLGNLYSIQVIESVALLVMCLIKLVRVERNLVFLLASFTYIFCLIVLTGAYMMAGGDVTHEASQVSLSIYYSGWELIGVGRQAKALVVLALQRSHVPVYMCAFGIITLSYGNFISVIRSSYSFFAVMY